MAKAKILNVDDDRAARYARNRLLANAGFEVVNAANGQEALAALESCPDLVILDVGLPDIDGYEVCRRIKADPRTSTITVLQISASFVRGADRTRALEGGADNFVIEPVEPEVLIATVNAMLRVRRAEDALRRSAREWQVTLGAIREGVALLDAESRVVRCNPAFSDFVGRSPGNTENASWPEMLSEVAPGEPASGPRFSIRVRERWVEVSVSALPDEGNERSGSVVVLTDVTEYRQSLAAAEEANRIKDDFLAILSHELRTPLNAIVGWSVLLQTGRLDPESTRKAVDTINRNAMMQNQLISDILDVSRIVAGKLRLEPAAVDLIAVIGAAVETVQPSALAKDVRIEVALAEWSVVVTGDATRLQQVIWNLLSNAIKFAPKGGLVAVRLRDAGDSAEIVVEDQGPGIAPAFLPFVFDRFRQADSSSTRPKGGLGLGLAIVRHLVELHGGTVEAANRRPSGAVFTVRLPKRAATGRGLEPSGVEAVDLDSAVALLSASRTQQPLAGVRLVVLDDEEDARDLLRAVLGGAGADVLTAASAAEALPLVERERPDVILCDIEMPGEDGYSFLAKMLALGPGRGGETPAIALTAYASREDASRAAAAGFRVHIAKPVSPYDLIAAVAAFARRAPLRS
jgi:signal transduction histidine kinase